MKRGLTSGMQSKLKNYLLTLCWLSIGCGTWIGNPKDPDEGDGTTGKATVELDVNSTNSALALINAAVPVKGVDGSQIGTFTFASATIVLKGIELSNSQREDDGELDFAGPYIVDLLTNTMTPAAPTAQLTPGFYDRIKLKLEKLEEEDATAADQNIVGRSVYLQGTFDNGSETKNITMTFELSEEFELQDGLNGINLVADAATSVLIQFDLAKWLDFANAETNESGLDFNDLAGSDIVLSEDAADENFKLIHEAIKEAIKESADFGKDKDGDGEIEDDEKEEEGE